MAVRPRRPRRSARPRAPASTRGGREGDDHLSALPDELLLIVLRGLDTRSALGAAALSRRLARLPRELPALNFRVSDALPPGYHQRAAELLRLRRRDYAPAPASRKLEASLAWYERRVMRGLAECIIGFLDAGEEGRAQLERRRVRRLGVEFFVTQDPRRVGCVHRLIHTAVGTWGVDELEVAVKPAPWRRRKVHYFFHVERLGADDGRPPRLTKLTLRNCPPAESLRELRALTALVLHDLPESTQKFVYDRLFTSGLPHLKKLHLKNCRCDNIFLVVGAPSSSATAITELVVDRCSFITIELRDATALEDLACIDDVKPVIVLFTNAPRLRRVHLSFSVSSGIAADAQYPLLPYKYDLSWHVRSEHMSSLAVRFTGPERWILPARVTTRLRNLRRLLVADVPSTWDVSWPRLLLQAAPSLETLHIHVAAQTPRRTSEEEEHAAADQPAPGREIIWPPATFRHRRLGELVVAGFGWTLGQVRFLRYVVKTCKALRRVELLRHGDVRYDGLWEWKVVRRQQQGGGGGERHWSREEEVGIKKQILCGRSWFREDVEVVLG